MEVNEIFEIKEGCYFGSSYFYFCDTSIDEYLGITDAKAHNGFSIEEEYVWDYLIPFINKYSDQNFGYGDEKCFTKEIVYKICGDIRDVYNVIKINFNDPSLDKLKKGFSIFFFASDEEFREYDLENKSDDEINLFIENERDRILDFYDRFIERITLLVNSTEKKVIYINTP